MIGPDGYGDAVVKRYDDGRVEVLHADEVIGISVELLAEALGTGLYVDNDRGTLWLAGDPEYKYRPTRFFCSRNGFGAVEGARVLVCERVR